ncbi:MAG: acetyl-CoA carboxylase carboxyl transferase subunit beta [Actinomycetota bacterium]|nr:acetyl-CoA carboxylase carboxyl transferase subunit beta [Actinomycetota bacterium]
MSKEIEQVIDRGSFRPLNDAPRTSNPLGYPDYERSLERARETTGSDESVAVGEATIDGVQVVAASFDFGFLGGSMGAVAGERIAAGMDLAASTLCPFVLRTATGGARMQEGMASLVQMPKTVAARLALARAHQPFVAVLGHPTTGGVLASHAALADFVVAEQAATIGFAGPRIVERVTGEPPGPDSHNAASALGAGLVDAVCPPEEVAELVARFLKALATPTPEESQAPEFVEPHDTDAWEFVTTARDQRRPTGPDLARGLGTGVELRGDRAGVDDRSVYAGVVRIAGRPAVAIATDRSSAIGPAAYRKACRAVDIATRLELPVVTVVDTPGADPGEASEKGGIAWAIARLFETLLQAPVPVLSVVTGEGGSGGALAFAAGDLLVAYDDTVFSVIGVELAAEILWRDASRGADAARLLKVSASDLRRLGIADVLVAGPPDESSIRSVVAYHLDQLADEEATGERRALQRQQKWRTLAQG